MPLLASKPKIRRTVKRNYASLVRELAITDFKLKYQGSIIGYLWSLAKPLAIFGVLYLVFTVFVRIPSDIPNYPLYLLLGVVLWNYFAESTLSGMRSIVDKGDLIRKVYFPRIVILLASSISALITLTLNLMVIVIFIVIFGVQLQFHAGLFLFLIIELYFLSLGVSLFLSALYVRFRDFAHIWEVALQLLFYGSAVIFDLHIVPRKFIRMITLSPITQILQDSRKVLISPTTLTTFDVATAPLALVPYLIPPILAISGWVYFNNSANKFAEEV